MHRRKIDKAILEIREILRDMQQAQSVPELTSLVTATVDEPSSVINN